MWSSRRSLEADARPPGIKARLSAAWTAARDLVTTRIAIFKEEAAEKGSTLARGAILFAVALAVAWIGVLLFTALIAVLLGRLFGSTWAGLLGAFVLYLLGAAGAALAGIRSFKNFRAFDFPETRKGLKEDWQAVKGSLQAPPEAEEQTDLEQRFRAGSE